MLACAGICWRMLAYADLCSVQAGGKSVKFDETLTFLNKALMESTLKVGIYHKNMEGNVSLMAQVDVNLNLQSLQEDAESEVASTLRPHTLVA
jgi:hypothetical protein